MAGGRPKVFTKEHGDEICGQIMTTTQSIRSICEGSERLPHAATVYRELATNPQFCDQYEKSKLTQLLIMAEETVDIADNGTNDWTKRLAYKGPVPDWEVNGENINRSRLRVDTRKWLLSKLLPKKYGDRIEQRVADADGNKLESIVVQFVRPAVDTAAKPELPAGEDE